MTSAPISLRPRPATRTAAPGISPFRAVWTRHKDLLRNCTTQDYGVFRGLRVSPGMDAAVSSGKFEITANFHELDELADVLAKDRVLLSQRNSDQRFHTGRNIPTGEPMAH